MVSKTGSFASEKELWNLTVTVARSFLSTQACAGCPSHHSLPDSLCWRGCGEGLSELFHGFFCWLLASWEAVTRQSIRKGYFSSWQQSQELTVLSKRSGHYSVEVRCDLAPLCCPWCCSRCCSLALRSHLASWGIYLMNVFSQVGMVMSSI